ncbi:MAG TPA: hypothetical protein VLH17_15925, partial [Candidatus Binatia bacterium]|nr:hypothetical protein [Candidatus Binatia bacterium]
TLGGAVIQVEITVKYRVVLLEGNGGFVSPFAANGHGMAGRINCFQAILRMQINRYGTSAR